ncbi:MAG: 16S rRNA (cytosine(1402)-N(4))-methyltransferase RsmH [Silvanigrellales bacterium]|nr:16S rRNA (cytosine(1402)-N(4))-methyltransferase RsmH [Silvanigrellales bacterium]
MEKDFSHEPVLLTETLSTLVFDDASLTPLFERGRKEVRLVDCTLGGAGHARAMVVALSKRLEAHAQARGEPAPHILLVGFDRDAIAREASTARLDALAASLPSFRYELVPQNFADAKETLRARFGPFSVDLLLADFGVSSPQLDVADRGFSFQRAGPLDMRMDPREQTTARTILETYDAQSLTALFRESGEEPRARKLAEAVVADRTKGTLPLSNTVDFAAWAARVLGYHNSRVHPATRIFQALRIEVNRELEAIEALLDAVPLLLGAHGRAGFISFHSLEDRLVKRRMRAWQAAKARAPEGREEDSPRPPWEEPRTWGREHPRGGLVAGDDEGRMNPRARSARLRVFRFGGLEDREEFMAR